MNLCLARLSMPELISGLVEEEADNANTVKILSLNKSNNKINNKSEDAITYPFQKIVNSDGLWVNSYCIHSYYEYHFY